MADKKEMMSEKYEDQVPGRQINTKSGKSDDTLCMPCSKKNRRTSASVYCPTCDEFQCSNCSQIHELYAFMKTHQLVDAEKVGTKPVSFDMKGLDQCEQHNKTLKLFCEDENQLCCSTCAIVEHRKCQRVVEIHKLAGKSTSTRSELKIKLLEVKNKAETVIKHTQSSKEQLDHDVEEVPLTIRQMRKHVMKMFDELEVSVARKTDSFKTETLNKLSIKQSDCEKHAADATKSVETMESAYQNGTPTQQFILEHNMKKVAETLSIKVEKECQMLESVTVSFHFEEKISLPPLPISDHVPGQLTLKCISPEAEKPITPVDPVVKITSHDVPRKLPIKCIQSEAKKSATPIAQAVKFKKITSLDLKQTGDDVKEPFYTGMDFLPGGRLVAVDNQNKKCLIYNCKLKKVCSYQLSYYPQSVVAVSEEEVAITSGYYKIDFLRVSKSNEITLIRTCKVETMYASICMKDERNFVVGTYDDTRPVRIVSLSGEEKDFSINFPNKKYPVDTSACCYIRNTEKVILTDSDEHTVYIYDVATSTRVVVKADQIKEPVGVAVGPADCILVCSNQTHTIVQVSPTGRVLSSYKLEMKGPYRVCVSKDKSIIAVTNNLNGGKILQLLKIT